MCRAPLPNAMDFSPNEPGTSHAATPSKVGGGVASECWVWQPLETKFNNKSPDKNGTLRRCLLYLNWSKLILNDEMLIQMGRYQFSLPEMVPRFSWFFGFFWAARQSR